MYNDVVNTADMFLCNHNIDTSTQMDIHVTFKIWVDLKKWTNQALRVLEHHEVHLPNKV